MKLKDRLELLYGFAVRVDDEQKGKYPVFGSNGITGYIDNYKIEAPGIIVGRKGSVGKVSFSDLNFTPTDTAYYVNILDKGKDNLKFWYYYLQLFRLEKLNTHSSVWEVKKLEELSFI
ncbi:MAG: restriction endonuclease subunit S [Bacteroidales bacterium]|jgi:type I restriction enzyme S subunit|nr:restriction endonuclease subunit S [Bacteroidales bacterium]